MKIPNSIVVKCAQLSKAAYADPGDDDQAWDKHSRLRLPARGYRDVATWVSSDSEIVAASYGNYRIYAWRGTASIADWIHNLSAKLVSFYKSGKVHSGFEQNYRSVANQSVGEGSLESDLESARWSNMKIICTGHSLGGATAAVMAAHELQHSRGIQGLITFGSPRAGSAAFAASLEAGIRMSGGEILRFVNKCDPVPLLPSLRKYRHAGDAHYFARDGSLKVHPSFAWMGLDRFLISMERMISGQRGAITDHSMEKYLAKTKDKFRG